MGHALCGAFLLVLAGACAGAPRGAPAPVRDQYLLQADELWSLGPDASMYEVIERLRHRWMEIRAMDPAVPQATDRIGVYAGTRLLGGLNELRFIQARSVASARFVDGREAASLYGPGHSSGVIILEMQ